MVAPGAMLTDAKRRWQAQVRADGSIDCDGQPGSIHKVGAALQGAPSCNGWTFWHVEQDGQAGSRSTRLRQQLSRATLTKPAMACARLSPPDRLRRFAVRP